MMKTSTLVMKITAMGMTSTTLVMKTTSLQNFDDNAGDEDDLPRPPYLPYLEAVVHTGRHDPGALQVEVSAQHFIPGRGSEVQVYSSQYS